MKDFIIIAGVIGTIIGAVLTVISRLTVCNNCPYASDRYKKEKEKKDGSSYSDTHGK